MNKNNNINNLINLSKEDSLDDIRNYLSKNLNQLFINLENNGDNAKYNISFGLKSYDFINKIILNEISKLPILKNISFIYKIEQDTCDDIMETIATLILNGKNIYIESNSNKDYLSNGLLIDEAKGKSNIANVSINIARLGIKYKSLNEEFYKELNESLELTKSALIFIFETIGDKLKDNYQYLFNDNLLDDEKLDYNQHIRKVIKAGTININLVGLKECAMVINSDDYQNTLVELIKAIRIRVNALKDDSKYNFTLSAINQENVSKEMIELDKSVYGNINKVTKKDEYENISLVSNSNLDSELKEFSNYYKAFDGGILTEIVLNKSTSVKHIKEVLNLIVDNNMGIVNVQIRGES
jgi:anaerobic ribonucleoside-triphosphate reductase